jgi:alpha-methylacyl-CoA racemase
MTEAPEHPHIKQRRTYTDIQGVLQPSPAPRFSRTVPVIKNPPPDPGQDTEAVLVDFGFTEDEMNVLRAAKAI